MSAMVVSKAGGGGQMSGHVPRRRGVRAGMHDDGPRYSRVCTLSAEMACFCVAPTAHCSGRLYVARWWDYRRAPYKRLRKNDETHLDAFEMTGPRKILRVLWTVKKTNEWVHNKAEGS